MKISLFIPFVSLSLMVSACAMPERSASNQDRSICEAYSWAKLDKIAQSHLDDFSYTSFVMQGQSSEYNISQGANHILAFERQIPDSLISVLQKIASSDCE